MIVQIEDHEQYLVKMDGTGRSSLRNRQFLRPVTLYSSLASPTVDTADTMMPTLGQDSSNMAPQQLLHTDTALLLPQQQQLETTSPPLQVPAIPLRRLSKRDNKGNTPKRLITTMAAVSVNGHSIYDHRAG
jgi:hypothetical protein